LGAVDIFEQIDTIVYHLINLKTVDFVSIDVKNDGKKANRKSKSYIADLWREGSVY
jgi:hypothetical protein